MSVLKEAPVVSSSVNTFKCPAPKKPKSNIVGSSNPPEAKKSTKSPLEINAQQKKPKPSKHVKEFNDIFSCYLCHGYLINATTIDNCLHSFCRSCIVNYLLSSSKNNHCPKCGNAERNVNLSNLRRDEQLQSVVYKIVPDLYKKEMERQEHFHKGQNSLKSFAYDDTKFFGVMDLVSLSLEYYTSSAESLNDLPPIRYLQCPFAVTVSNLQKFLCVKYDIDLDKENLTIDIIYEDEVLPSSFMLMDVAYIFNWKKCAPLRLFYRILIKNLCNKLDIKTEREEENLVPKQLDMVVKTVRFKDEDSKNAGNILKSRKSIKLFQNNNNTITNIKTVTEAISPGKQNVLMATFGRKKEVKINKQNNNYTTTFVKDFKSLRSNDICKPVEKKCNSIPLNIKPMVSIPQIEVQRALKHSADAINKLSIKEEKPIEIPKIKIFVPKQVKEEPIDSKMFRKLSIDERPVNENVDLETYVKKIGLQPIDKKIKLSPNTSPSSSCSSSASSVTSSFTFNNNDSEHHHRHSLSSSSSSHKKRKKSKHSKESKDKDSKKRKIHAEISSNNENLKLKVKINHHNHKSSNDKVVKIVEAPILAPAQLSKSAIEKLRCEPPPQPPSHQAPAQKPVPKQCPPITSIKLKDTKLPISPPLPPSLFKTLPHTIQTVTATSTLSPIPPTLTVNRSNVKQITTNTNSKEKFIMPSPPKTMSSSSSSNPIKVNLITSIASEANRQASMKRSISVDETIESKKKIAKMASEEKTRRISFGSLTNQQKPFNNQTKSVNNKLCDDLKKSLSTSNLKLPQPVVLSPTKTTRPPPPTIPLLKIKRSLQLPTSPTNNNEPPGLISMKTMKGINMTTSSKTTSKEIANNVLDLSLNNLKVDTKNCIEDALKKIRQNHNYSSVSSTSSSLDLKTVKSDSKINSQSQRILPNLPKLNEISKIRPQNSSVRSIPNPSALIRNIQEVPALATISPTPLPTTNGKEIKVENVTSNGKDTSESVVSSSTVSSQGSNSSTDDEKKAKKNLNLEILAANLNMRAAAAADSKVSPDIKLSPKGNNYIVSTSTSVVSSTEAGSAKTSGNFNIASIVATTSPKSV